MNFELIRALETLLLPPSGLITLGIIGLLFGFTRSGRQLLGISMLLLYLMSTTYVSAWMNSRLTYQYPAVDPALLKSENAPQALVVLGGGYYGESVEYGNTAIGPFFAERIRYAAWLAKQTELPIIVSSGKADAPAAVRILKEEYGIENVTQESNSWTTDDNARYLNQLIKEKEIGKIGVITHAWHMPRAMWSLESHNIDATALPMGLLASMPAFDDYNSWLPSMAALVRSRNVMHEFFGLIWYQLRGMGETLVDIFSFSAEDTTAETDWQNPIKQD
ncbi:YdcF family protein [Solemya velum gill symbiont]|uniref:DUF218 domain-containing protein n=1 Tax=Solemya velum gill symbiont TaxID=2340 RepID=A0A1T2HSC6_SOVGS|nr:YdcF family protein [Solemya velum gill symbiont]OOY34336.1 hypothetical protein BOV88_10665 [Solemya velum gill symbiont]OOY36986.1 hypothetical protein BOV89_09825 [Solemya velum gill symbiont]OOY39847.1 hypothetical protein BOV90_07085 [Solemya velum gill symbiont]OOY44679.1 hypothetical protein BOV91_00660 [Solemya velum gill symbiont]OOY46362.1 hypothetical protein BOV93_10445 [Solemya velum gill symbiont]